MGRLRQASVTALMGSAGWSRCDALLRVGGVRRPGRRSPPASVGSARFAAAGPGWPGSARREGRWGVGTVLGRCRGGVCGWRRYLGLGLVGVGGGVGAWGGGWGGRTDLNQLANAGS